ncbi:pilus assembly PilX N-terminal domain-containing protein [uncultured Halomonas sp.]|uniref:pilus assembly PilX N-terminal domain-containing protein n=1 Tax=uncultured Halomonas sp. TaxID=173971 RepID=UPI002602B8DE|nr:pilus assembly PilX N-terminal domain-containing protein [uncultured Halomonas sp.]
MHKQKGVALIVVMSLLAISLMIGLMSMQSSQVDERLAGNYKAAAEAQMAAEFGAAYGMEMLETSGYFDENVSVEECEAFAKAGLSEPARRNVDGDVEWNKVDVFDVDAEIIGCQYEGEPLYLSWGQVRDGDGAIIAERFVIFGDGGDDVLSINGSPPLSSPLVCLRSASAGCGWNDEDVSDYFDGRPHPVPGDFDCAGDDCRTDPEGKGEEAAKYKPEMKGEWEDFLSALVFDEVIVGGGGASLSQGERGVYSNIEVVPGSGNGRVTSGGSVNTSGIIVVRSGAEFRGQGTGHHEGLIVVEEGGSLDLSNNYNVYGAVVALGEITLGGWSGGNIQGGVRYSAISSGESGGGGDFVWQIL